MVVLVLAALIFVVMGAPNANLEAQQEAEASMDAEAQPTDRL